MCLRDLAKATGQPKGGFVRTPLNHPPCIYGPELTGEIGQVRLAFLTNNNFPCHRCVGIVMGML